MMADQYQRHKEYLRTRFEKLGVDGLLPKEAIELLLGYVIKGRGLPELVTRLFDRYGNITAILNADPDELAGINGMTDEAVDMFRFMPQLYSIYSNMHLYAPGLDDPEKACEYFSRQLRWTPVEQFKLVCLDTDFSAISCMTISEGSGSEVKIDMDEILRIAITMTSRFVIIGHNHPSGSCTPSESDIRSTEILQRRLLTCGIFLLDHIIVGVDGVCSMTGSGSYPLRVDKRAITESLKYSDKEYFERYSEEINKI